MSDVDLPSLDILSICPGGGGLDAGVRLALPGARSVCYVEIEAPAVAVLAKAIAAGILHDAPVWTDLFTFPARGWRGLVDGVVGGIPCQPHSYAGKRGGEDDPRNLWPVTARLVHEVAPAFCFFENVPGIAPYYWRVIRPDLQALGYEVEEGIFSAEEVGAPHLRERLFWLAYRNDLGCGAGEKAYGQESHAERLRLQLADSRYGARSTQFRQQQEVSAAKPRLGGGVLADASDRQLSQPWRGAQGRAGTGSASALVGIADSARRETARQRRGEHSGTQPQARSGSVGNADEPRLEGYRLNGQRADERTAWRPSSPSGRIVDDASCCDGRLHEGRWEEGARATFPPGPSDAVGWRDYLESGGPAPVTTRAESILRLGFDGMAYRTDELRVLGNGVVPVVAAHALLTLEARMGVRLLSLIEKEKE